MTIVVELAVAGGVVQVWTYGGDGGGGGLGNERQWIYWSFPVSVPSPFPIACVLKEAQ